MYCVEQKTGFAQDPDGPPLPAVLSRSHCCDHRWRSPRSCRLFSRLRVAPPSTLPGASRPLRSMSTPCGADTFQRAGPAEPCPENQGSSNPAAWSLSPALAPPHVASSGRRNGSPQMRGGHRFAKGDVRCDGPPRSCGGYSLKPPVRRLLGLFADACSDQRFRVTPPLTKVKPPLASRCTQSRLVRP